MSVKLKARKLLGTRLDQIRWDDWKKEEDRGQHYSQRQVVEGLEIRLQYKNVGKMRGGK